MQAADPAAAGYWNHFKTLNGNNCVSHRECILAVPASGHESPAPTAFGALGFRDVHTYEAPHFRSKWSQILKLLLEKIPFVLTNVDTEESFMYVEL